jgi:prepilin-type N-terminal cleavage/methylation domain-containing protein
MKKNREGFIQAPVLTNTNRARDKAVATGKISKNTQLAKTAAGFTLIELLVVIAIIALLASIALIALMSARQKSRDAKRVSDMVQMNTALSLYFSTYKGYPSSVNGLPSPLVAAGVATSLPANPLPGDGSCDLVTYSPPVPGGTYANQYYYFASGTAFLGSNNVTVYPDYGYYFCLGAQTGSVSPGLHISTPEGLK